jgi:predicted TIM-barrel enzyme
VTVSFGVGIIRESQPEPLVKLDRPLYVGHDHSDDVEARHALIVAKRERAEWTRGAIAEALSGCPALLLCHGGPLTTPDAVRRAMRAAPTVVGYFGVSTLEQAPIQRAVRAAAAAYKEAPHPPPISRSAARPR